MGNTDYANLSEADYLTLREANYVELCTTYQTAVDAKERNEAFDAIRLSPKVAATTKALAKRPMQGMSSDDVEQELLIILIKAITDYDPVKSSLPHYYSFLATNRLRYFTRQTYQSRRTNKQGEKIVPVSLNDNEGIVATLVDPYIRNPLEDLTASDAVAGAMKYLGDKLTPLEREILTEWARQETATTDFNVQERIADALGKERKQVDNALSRIKRVVAVNRSQIDSIIDNGALPITVTVTGTERPKRPPRKAYIISYDKRSKNGCWLLRRQLPQGQRKYVGRYPTREAAEAAEAAARELGETL